MPGLLDHLFVVVLVVVAPLSSLLQGGDELRAMRDAEVRRSAYLRTILWQWGLTVLLLGLWIWSERSWTALGLGLPLGWGLASAAGLSVILLVLMQRQLQRVRREPRLRAKLRDQIGDLEGLMPTEPEDRPLFRAVAFTAGTCEELAYRGFLLWYLGTWFGLWVAVPVSALAFGAIHLYQGPRHAAQVAGFGLVSALLYVLAGSLWLPMLMHVLTDLNQVATVRVALEERPSPPLAGELPLEPSA